MQEKHDLAFTVLSDPGNGIAHTLGILTQPTDEARAAQLELGLDLTAVNADGTTGIPMPTMMPLTECPQGRSSEFPTWLTLSLLRLVMGCHGSCRRVAVVL